MSEIAVIVPVYNCEKYLDDCIKSILNQTYKDFEFILIDDGSTDSSFEICKKYENIDKRIKVIHQENKGVSIARNNGLKFVDADYVMFVDSDDLLEENVIQKMYSSIIQNKSDLSVCGIRSFSEKNANIGEWKCREGSFLVNEYVDIMLIFRTIPFVGGPVAKIYSKKIIDNFDIKFEEGESFAEDFMFNMNYLQKISKVSIVDEVFYLRREDNNYSLSKTKRQQIPLWERKKNVYNKWIETLSILSDNKVQDYVLIQKFAVKSLMDVVHSSYEKYQIVIFLRKVIEDTDIMIKDSKMIKSYKIIHKLFDVNSLFTLFILKFLSNPIFQNSSLLKRMNK